MTDIIITREMLDALNACEEAKVFITNNNLWDKTEPEVLDFFVQANATTQYKNWWLQKKQTEEFVRYNGQEIIMGEYKVFNPLTGQHATFLTEEEAKTALIQVAKAVLAQHCPKVLRAMRNENGDETWLPTEIHNTIQIS